MSNPRIASQLLAAGRFVENLGIKRPAVTQHYRAERNSVGYPARTLGDGGSRATSDDTSVERAAAKLDDLELSMADIEAGEKLLLATIADLAVSYDRFLGIRLPKIVVDDTKVFDRCAGGIDPDNLVCTEHAADHHDPDDQSTITTLCSRCWALACKTCYTRPAEDRRVGGLRACEACYRRTLRASNKIEAA